MPNRINRWYLLAGLALLWLLPFSRRLMVATAHLTMRPFTYVSGWLFARTQPAPHELQKSIDRLTQENSELHATLTALTQSESARTFAEQYRTCYNRDGMVVSITQPLYSAQRHQCVIEACSGDGVTVGMVLQAPDGSLLGTVTSCTTHSSIVQLISDKDTAIPVVVASTGMPALAVGTGTWPPRLMLQHKAHTESITYPSVVLSSSRTGTCPDGVRVGMLTHDKVIVPAQPKRYGVICD